MTNDVVGGGGILTPAFQKCWLQSGWLFCDVNGNQGLMTVARLPGWLADGRSQDYDADDAKSW